MVLIAQYAFNSKAKSEATVLVAREFVRVLQEFAHGTLHSSVSFLSKE